jgi:hypothetical protein
MDRYIGVDAHASSCTLAVVSGSGKRIGTQVVETNARCLIEAVRQIPNRGRAADPEAAPHVPGGGDAVGVAVRGAVAACRGGGCGGGAESRGPKDDRRDASDWPISCGWVGVHRKVYKERGRFRALGYRARAHRWVRWMWRG